MQIRMYGGIYSGSFFRSIFPIIEKFFNEDMQSILMKEIIKENVSGEEPSLDECCSIAESMMEEIHQIMIPDNALMPYINSGDGRHKGSLKRRLLKQIKQARIMARVG